MGKTRMVRHWQSLVGSLRSSRTQPHPVIPFCDSKGKGSGKQQGTKIVLSTTSD